MTKMPPRFKVIECQQGSIDWHMARCGVISASNFKIARQWVGGLDERQQRYVNLMRSGADQKAAMVAADYKAAPTSQAIARAIDGESIGDFGSDAKDLAFRYACEQISRQPMDEMHQTWQMERGQEMEPAARAAHEIAAGVMVEPAGFITTLDGTFGASADGLIGEDAGSEYKCLVSPKGIRKVWLNDDLSEFIDQIQGCMWITGRKRWHFGMYCPALAPVGKELYWQVIERDDAYIEALEHDLWRFAGLVAKYRKTLELRAAR